MGWQIMPDTGPTFQTRLIRVLVRPSESRYGAQSAVRQSASLPAAARRAPTRHLDSPHCTRGARLSAGVRATAEAGVRGLPTQLDAGETVGFAVSRYVTTRTRAIKLRRGATWGGADVNLIVKRIIRMASDDPLTSGDPDHTFSLLSCMSRRARRFLIDIADSQWVVWTGLGSLRWNTYPGYR